MWILWIVGDELSLQKLLKLDAILTINHNNGLNNKTCTVHILD